MNKLVFSFSLIVEILYILSKYILLKRNSLFINVVLCFIKKLLVSTPDPKGRRFTDTFMGRKNFINIQNTVFPVYGIKVGLFSVPYYVLCGDASPGRGIGVGSLSVSRTQLRSLGSVSDGKVTGEVSLNKESCNRFKNITPVVVYSNVDTMKLIILKENNNKAGIYMWVNLHNGKIYIGSSINLTSRFRKYFSINFLEKEIIKNKSKIYNSIFKNGYSGFRLEILEYCEGDIVREREQYYIDMLSPEYNILKTAGSLLGFKHSEATRELMKLKHKSRDKQMSNESRIKLITSRQNGESIIVVNQNTDESLSFLTVTEAAKFIGINRSFLFKSIKDKKFYLGRGFLIYRSFTPLQDIISSEAYLAANEESSYKSKANLGCEPSKLSLNVGKAKAVIVINNETKETLEFNSIAAASDWLGISKSYISKCINNKKPCKGFTIVFKL